MLFRLVSPVKRSGTENRQFVQRIPQAIRPKVAGQTFKIEITDEQSVSITVSPRADAIRFSLRTSNASEAKKRQARVAAALERIWEALRADVPVSLSHRQATALSGKLYRALNRPEFSRRPLIAFCAAVRTRRVTATRFVHASGWGYRTSRYNRTRLGAPRPWSDRLSDGCARA